MSRLAELERAVAPYRMTGSAAMQAIARDGLSLGQARAIAREYGPGNAASPQIMAAGIAQIWDEDLRISLVENLYDECGRGDRKQSHIAMFARFMAAVDVPPALAARIDEGTRTHVLVHSFLRVCAEGPAHRALGILHGFEDVFSYICALVARGLEKSRIISPEAGEFFRHHAVADIVHAERMRDAMLGAADSDARWDECLELVKVGASLIHDLFEHIATEVR